jgi:predicted nucleic acid-binding protein
MAVERVLDASVLGAALFLEIHSPLAHQALTGDTSFIAPDLIFAEMASLAAKKVWRGEEEQGSAAEALSKVSALLSEIVPMASLTPRAFELAASIHVSAYDAIYLALAEARGIKVVTADARLARSASTAGLGDLIESLV